MDKRMYPNTAIILAGGVAKAAFEAGALEVLADANITAPTVIATSAGALNATLYAAGIRTNQVQHAAHTLVDLWVEDGGWRDVLDFSAGAALHGRALSTSDKLIALMHRYIDPLGAVPAVIDVQLRIVVAPLLGVRSSVGSSPATSFEAVLAFDAASYATAEGRATIYHAAAASAAFPFVFEAVDVDGLGPCYDGGVVNDAPFRVAMDCGASRVILITPFPLVFTSTEAPTGWKRLPHLIDVLIHERLYRDLRDAVRVNRRVDALMELHASGVLTADQLAAVKHALDEPMPLDIVQIRPDAELPGSAFSGLFDKGLREQYVAAGRRAAEAALAQLSAQS